MITIVSVKEAVVSRLIFTTVHCGVRHYCKRKYRKLNLIKNLNRKTGDFAPVTLF